MNASSFCRRLLWLMLLLPLVAHGGLSIHVGPTPIPRGDATGDRDITVGNGIFAVAFAVDSAPPWGVARGGIIDIALLDGDDVGYDIASLADFMPNNWSSWPTTYQSVSVEQPSDEMAIVRTERDFGDVRLVTAFHIRDADNRIRIVTTMTNRGDAPLEGHLSGYVVWPDGGYLLVDPPLRSGWSAAYDQRWLLGLYSPDLPRAVRGGRDRYRLHDLAPGESREFEAWLQIENTGSLAPLVATQVELSGADSGSIFGQVRTESDLAVAEPAVLVFRDDEPYAWTLGMNGRYEFQLPTGEYEVIATARSHAPGQRRKVRVGKGDRKQVDFNEVERPGEIRFSVADAGTGTPLDARISIDDGLKPPIGYFGNEVLFTSLGEIGALTETIAPGSYRFKVTSGAGFLSAPAFVDVVVESGHRTDVAVEVAILARPSKDGWYNADLHHHSDVLDGYTDPASVLSSELAAGVDLAFLSDHDSTINNAPLRKLAKERGIPFIPGTELSPSYGHFNAYPVDDDKSVEIDTGQSTVQQVFAEARRIGADVIEVNHPFSSYGYFENLENGVVPGGYDDGFDLVEIEPVIDNYGEEARNTDTIEKAWELWNSGKRAYLAAGSDVHDVWRFVSARARTFAFVEGDLTVEKFVAALKAGRSYASQGPLVFPDTLFGSDIRHPPGEILILGFELQSVSGLKGVRLIERGQVVDTAALEDSTNRQRVRFEARPTANTWYSLVVEDTNGRFAYTNPVWVRVTD